MEPVETRLARIEEHQVFIRGEVKEIKTMLKPLVEQSNSSAQEIALLKQERRINGKWLMLAVAAVSGLIGHISDTLLHFFKG